MEGNREREKGGGKGKTQAEVGKEKLMAKPPTRIKEDKTREGYSPRG